MEAYTGFAEVYDTFMDNIDYDFWTEYLAGLLRDFGVESGLVAELGCGTGSVTVRLADAGYDMIGIDYSEEMLAIARNKQSGREILYLLQDMREFELYGTVRAVVSICDSMNYITEPEDLKKVFRLVNNYLERGGLFIFDLNTPYKYETVLGENTFAETRDDCCFIWENYYDGETRINEYDLNLFIRQQEQYERFEEFHYQRCYSLEEIRLLLEEAGMEYVCAYDAFTREEPRPESERIYVIARERTQANKYYGDEEKA